MVARQSLGAGQPRMSPDRRDKLAQLLAPEAIERRRASVSATLRAAAASGNLLIVGSAHLPQKVARAIQEEGGRVAAVAEFDPRFWGREVAGLPVLALDEALARTGPHPVAVVGIWSPSEGRRLSAICLPMVGSYGFSLRLPVSISKSFSQASRGAW